MIDFFFSRFPFFYWIIKYNLKENLLKDFITGLTVSLFYYFTLFVNKLLIFLK